MNLLGTLESEKQDRWVDHLPELVHTYNNGSHTTTEYGPFYLMFGRHARLLIDMVLGTAKEDHRFRTQEWVQRHQARFTYDYEKAGEHSSQATQQMQSYYDRAAREVPLVPGERVLVEDSRRRARGVKSCHMW